jgi:hypothetical protein
MAKILDKKSVKSSFKIPEQYRARFEDERLETNVARMQGFAMYIVLLQIVLQIANAIFPQSIGAGMQIPLIYYIVLSLITLFTGIIYWILLSLAKRHTINSRRVRKFLVYSLLYIYFFIQMTFCTFNILSHQGINGQIILVLLFGMIPILRPLQSVLTILCSFFYTSIFILSTQNNVDANGGAACSTFLLSEWRA